MCGDDLFLMSESKEGLLNMLDHLHVYCKSWNILVCPKYLCGTFRLFLINTHTCEKSATQSNERENIQDMFIDTLSFFTRKKITGTKTNIFLTFFYNGKCIQLFSIRYSLLIPRYFNVIIRVLSIYFFFGNAKCP